jgi:hypothetical protein
MADPACPGCGASRMPADAFCAGCGRSFATASAQRAVAWFLRFFSAGVLAGILALGLGGYFTPPAPTQPVPVPVPPPSRSAPVPRRSAPESPPVASPSTPRAPEPGESASATPVTSPAGEDQGSGDTVFDPSPQPSTPPSQQASFWLPPFSGSNSNGAPARSEESPVPVIPVDPDASPVIAVPDPQ